jgi:hypothetical protein
MKAVEGHMKTDNRWPTSVFHECRQCDEFSGIGEVSVDGYGDGSTLADGRMGSRAMMRKGG